MRKIAMAVAAAALLTGPLATAQTAYAGQTTRDTTVSTQPQTPDIQPLDCVGTTGAMGCGPGWFWRDGWRGWACYVC